MQFSTKVRYALRIMMDIADNATDGKAREVSRIAAAQNISAKYMSRLMIPLRRAGLVVSESGPLGGYRLARPATEITYLDVVEAMEGPLRLVPCVEKPRSCKRFSRCAAAKYWNDLNEGFRSLLRGASLRMSLRTTVNKGVSNP